MESYKDLKNAVETTVYPNGIQAITGTTMQQTLLTMLNYSKDAGGARFINWNTSFTQTRLSVDPSDRKFGLILSYLIGDPITGKRVIEQYILPDSVPTNKSDDSFQNSTFWESLIIDDADFPRWAFGYSFENNGMIQKNNVPMLTNNDTGEYHIVFDVPNTAPFGNQMLFCWENKTMFTLYESGLYVYWGGEPMRLVIDLTPYLGEQIFVRWVKNSNMTYNIFINGKVLDGGLLSGTAETGYNQLTIGQYSGGGLASTQTIYHFRAIYNDATTIDVDFWNKADNYVNVTPRLFGLPVNSEPAKNLYIDALKVIPSNIYIAQNSECNIWYSNVIPTFEKDNVVCESSGGGQFIRNMDRCLRYTPTSLINQTLSLSIYDTFGQDSKATQSVVMNAINPTAGTGTLQFLFVGDSTIDDPTPGIYGYDKPAIVQHVYDLCDNNKGFTPLFIGHKKNYPPYYHAGMSGWASSDFLNSNSPFWYNGANDFQHYVQTVISDIPGATNKVDFMIYQIGINDLKNDSIPASTVIENIKTFVNQFRAAYPSAKIIIGFPASGCDTTGYSLHFFGNSSYLLFTNKMRELWKLIIDNFDNGAYASNVYICNAGQWVDRKYGFPHENLPPYQNSPDTEFSHTDSVHPNQSGYFCMGDAYFGRIKSLV